MPNLAPNLLIKTVNVLNNETETSYLKLLESKINRISAIHINRNYVAAMNQITNTKISGKTNPP